MSKPLTIHELAAATGVSPATLRAWENRHGFPEPERAPNGHRRYPARAVDAVRAVLAERTAGSTLAAAIRRVRATSTTPAWSLFAELGRAGHPLAHHVVSKRTMIVLSHAIEDECSLAAERGILIGAFQTRRSYKTAEARWRVLARGATLAVVFADFAEAGPRTRPAHVPIRSQTPLEREWAIVHLAARSSVLLVGREHPEPARTDLDRRFEVYWSADPELVRQQVGLVAQIADDAAPEVGRQIHRELEALPHATGMDAGFVASLTTRMISYLDR